MSPLLAALALGAGLALVVVGMLLRSRDRDAELLALLEMPFGDQDATPERVERAGLLDGLRAAGAAVERLRPDERLATELQRARLPLKAGEFVVIVGLVTLLFGLWAWAALGQIVFGLVAVLVVPFVARFLVRRRVVRRQQAIETQLPGALSLLASSLQAGHSLLHAIEHLVGEADPPLSEEFERVVAETRLGDSLVDAMERMAARVGVSDLDWAVQAIRIQQTVGGKLADLLFTLADYLRARDEFRREVRVLTADGRMSAVILAALPFALLLAMQATNPSYASELFHGLGLLLLAGAAVSVAIGVTIIMRMVKVEL